MGISLNDHENRIKALEGKEHHTWKRIFYLYDDNTSSDKNNIKLNEPTTNFDIIVFEVYIVTWRLFVHVMTTPKLFFQKSNTDFIYCLYDSDNNSSYIKVSPKTDNINVSVIVLGFDAYVNAVWGLKLYYSFSYNIIYKILLRKISRLAKKLHFNLFEIPSRRGGVNYGY